MHNYPSHLGPRRPWPFSLSLSLYSPILWEADVSQHSSKRCWALTRQQSLAEHISQKQQTCFCQWNLWHTVSHTYAHRHKHAHTSETSLTPCISQPTLSNNINTFQQLPLPPPPPSPCPSLSHPLPDRKRLKTSSVLLRTGQYAFTENMKVCFNDTILSSDLHSEDKNTHNTPNTIHSSRWWAGCHQHQRHKRHCQNIIMKWHCHNKMLS